MGFKYKDKAGFPGGIRSLGFKAGLAGEPKIILKAKSGSLALPPLPLAPLVTVQFVIDDSGGELCREATYSVVKKNDAGQFKAKSD